MKITNFLKDQIYWKIKVKKLEWNYVKQFDSNIPRAAV